MARIMIVEDNRTTAEILSRMLRSMNHAVTSHISRGEDALEILREEPADLILMDIDLKGEMNGMETAREISESYQIPILYTTSHDDLDLSEEYAESSYGYLKKPYNEQELKINIDLSLCKCRMDRKLRKSKKYIFSILQSMSEALLVIGSEGSIQTVNNAAEQLLGLPSEKLIGESIAHILGTEESYFETEIGGMELQYDRGGGDIRYLLRKRNWINGEDSGGLYGIETITDITKLKELELYKLRVEKERLIHNNDKLNFINWKEMYGAKDSEVFNKVMYSLNTTVNSMGGPMLLDFMMSNIQKDDERYFFDEDIYSAFQELNRELNPLFSNLAEIDRILAEEIQTEPVALGDLEYLIKMVISANTENLTVRNQTISLNCALATRNSFCRLNTSYFSECMDELLINALKYSRKKAKVWIDLKQDRDVLKIDITNEAEEYEFRKQRVIGIPYEYSESVFNPFERLRREIDFGGIREKWNYGLGLFAVRTLILKMGGKIRCHDGMIRILSEIDKPITSFKIRFRIENGNT